MAKTEENPFEEKGVTPWVAESPAVWNPDKPTWGIFSHWQCPHCGANLSLGGRICLNGCGLSSRMVARRERKAKAVDQATTAILDCFDFSREWKGDWDSYCILCKAGGAGCDVCVCESGPGRALLMAAMEILDSGYKKKEPV